MTTEPLRELARKQPANLPTPARKTIDGQVWGPKDTPAGRFVSWVLLLLMAAFFAGFLLSTL